MGETVALREWEPTDLSSGQARDVRDTLERLSGELCPRPELAQITGNRVLIQNLIGTARMPSGARLEVAPKIQTGDSWAEAVVQLLDGNTRIAVTGSQRSRESAQRNDLTTALAYEYARRLEQALNRDGPIEIYEHHELRSPRLRGRLRVSEWVRSSILDPTTFPIAREDHTVANELTRGMSKVCGFFLRSALDGRLASKLRRLETEIIPGHPLPSYVNPTIASRNLPPQWNAYKPAWDIAAAILRNRSLVGDPGRAVGLEIALQPWPLLETLLERGLKEFVRRSAHDGVEFKRKKRWPLLNAGNSLRQSVEPDGLLFKNGAPAATFEAKYTRPDKGPSREHVFQALTTAAALSSPLAVIVYPGEEPPESFNVTGFQGVPHTLATVGLSMFSYSKNGGDQRVAACIGQVVGQQSSNGFTPASD